MKVSLFMPDKEKRKKGEVHINTVNINWQITAFIGINTQEYFI